MGDPSAERSLRLGLVTPWDVADVAALSGMPAAVWSALQRQGVELVHVQPRSLAPRTAVPRRGGLRRVLGAGFRALVPKARRWSARRRLRLLRHLTRRPTAHRALLWRAQQRGAAISRLLEGAELDGVLALCASAELYALQTELPIAYVTDGTPRLLQESYPDYARHSRDYHRLRDEIERACLAKAAVALFPSERTLRSAVQDYALPRERAHLVPFGAGVVPDSYDALDPQPPGPRSVELALVAADPLRKRLDLCIDVAEELVRRGFRALLHYIGPLTGRAARSPLVHALGKLSLASPGDRRQHQEVLRRSHFLLLPSLGEMYGIAAWPPTSAGPAWSATRGACRPPSSTGARGWCFPSTPARATTPTRSSSSAPIPSATAGCPLQRGRARVPSSTGTPGAPLPPPSSAAC